SLSWWEHFGRYHDHFEAPQFAFHFFSRAIPLDKLATRDPRFVADVSGWWSSRFGAAPLATPLSVGGRKTDGRVVSVTPPAGAAVVAVSGGSPVTRVLLCEEARMVRGTPALLVDDGLRAAQAATMVLSGRADLVGASEAVAESWAAAAPTIGAPA